MLTPGFTDQPHRPVTNTSAQLCAVSQPSTRTVWAVITTRDARSQQHPVRVLWIGDPKLRGNPDNCAYCAGLARNGPCPGLVDHAVDYAERRSANHTGVLSVEHFTVDYTVSRVASAIEALYASRITSRPAPDGR